MTINSILQILIYFALVFALTKPLGLYMHAVYSGRRVKFTSILRPLEVFCYQLTGIDEQEEHDWKRYAFDLLAFSFIGCILSYILLRLQGELPLNPRGVGSAEMTSDLAFNAAISFTTNTNWQSYSPEVTVSYFSNMVSLAIHNWMSAAAGMAVAVAVIRGFCRRETRLIGNFWVDLTRSTVYLLLPIAFIAALLFIYTGVPQNFNSYTEATTVEGAKQLIAQGPIASQEAIKQLGTNGGGFFNANSAHPFENPSPASNLLSLILVFAIPAAFTFLFGEMAGNRRQGWAIFSAMSVLFLFGAFTCLYFEQQGTPHLSEIGINQTAKAGDAGGNMEGKEARFGVAESALFAAVTTGASCGAVNSMHDSFTPIGGLVPLFNILTGEVVFGGVGAGMYGILMLAILAVFIAGLMVGRTPEFLGKKIERFEVQMAMLATLVLAASILVFSAAALSIDIPAASIWSRVGSSTSFLGAPTNSLNNTGAHGLTEMLYAYTSATGNNGSAFAGLTANTPFFNLTLGVAMFIGRFLMIVPLLAMAGSLAAKKVSPLNSGTFPTDNATFAGLLIAIIVVVNALTFFPALSVGPVVEQFQMIQRKLQ